MRIKWCRPLKTRMVAPHPLIMVIVHERGIHQSWPRFCPSVSWLSIWASSFLQVMIWLNGLRESDIALIICASSFLQIDVDSLMTGEKGFFFNNYLVFVMLDCSTWWPALLLWEIGYQGTSLVRLFYLNIIAMVMDLLFELQIQNENYIILLLVAQPIPIKALLIRRRQRT